MSRIGNRVIDIPMGTSIEVLKGVVKISGKNGSIEVPFNKKIISVISKENKIFVKRANDEKESRMLHGTINANINNAIIGVNQGHSKSLKINGVGYRASVAGNILNLSLGYSHSINLTIPQGIKVECPEPTEVKISGPEKSVVGQFAAVIRSKRKPEPYQGKGVMYSDEHIVRKAGKTAEGKK